MKRRLKRRFMDRYALYTILPTPQKQRHSVFSMWASSFESMVSNLLVISVLNDVIHSTTSLSLLVNLSSMFAISDFSSSYASRTCNLFERHPTEERFEPYGDSHEAKLPEAKLPGTKSDEAHWHMNPSVPIGMCPALPVIGQSQVRVKDHFNDLV